MPPHFGTVRKGGIRSAKKVLDFIEKPDNPISCLKRKLATVANYFNTSTEQVSKISRNKHNL